MRKEWPGFRVLSRTRCDVAWLGALRALCQTHTILVAYYREPDRGLVGGCLPLVTVVDPLLHRRDETPHEPIPHHYPNPTCPELPFLCLYDPDAGEWDPGRAIARTIVPWAIDWLACYEGWLATGEWTGGGRHPVVA